MYGPAPSLARQVEYVARLALPGVLTCPFIIGFETVRSLARDHESGADGAPFRLRETPRVAAAGHRARVPPRNVGTLLRLAGADISIFPNVGGRFASTRDECTSITARLRAPFGPLPPAWPCPAGGMSFEQLPQMCADYGPDAVLLIAARSSGTARTWK